MNTWADFILHPSAFILPKRLSGAADDKALATNILYGAAGAAATAILLWLDLSDNEQPVVSLTPAGTGNLGLTLAGTF